MAYPQKFLGMICLMQSSYFQFEIMKYVDMCTSYTPFKILLKNTLIVKDSWLANSLGWSLFGDVNEV